MESVVPKLPIKNEGESSGLLSAEERARVEALEEYRAEVRTRLGEREKPQSDTPPWWKEKLVAPAVIVLLTVILSGIVAPKVLERSQKAQRAREITTQVLDEIALNTGEMKVAVKAHADALDTYWSDAARTNATAMEFAVRLHVGLLKQDTFDKNNALIENDRKRIQDHMDAATQAYDQQTRKFQTWVARTRVRLGSLYEPSPERTDLLKHLDTVAESVVKAEHALDEKDTLYDTALNHELTSFKQLRSRFEQKQLSRRRYQEGSAPIIARLRKFQEIDGPSRALNDSAIDQMMKIIQRMKPVT